MLDKLPAEYRHLTLILIVVVLSWAATTIPVLDLDPLIAPLAAAVVTALLAYFTPLIREYGVGKKKSKETPK